MSTDNPTCQKCYYLCRMNIEPENTGSRQTVSSYRDHEIVISGTVYHDSLIVTPENKPEPWHIGSFGELTVSDLIALKKYRPDIVLLGTGRQMHSIPAEWVFTLLEHGIIIECMNNQAACGTYNLMLAEERNAVLAIMMEEINR